MLCSRTNAAFLEFFLKLLSASFKTVLCVQAAGLGLC